MPRLPQTPQNPRRSAPKWVRRLIGPVLLFGLWLLFANTGVISERTLAPPGKVWAAFTDLVRTGELQHHIVVSLHRVVIGLVLGIAIGVVLALASGLFRIGEDLIDGPMQILRSMPVLALTGLLIVWAGIGESVKIWMVVLGVVFPVYINTFAAIRSVDSRLVESSATFGLGRVGLIRHVILPGALPGFFTGLRFAFAVSWLVLVVAEQTNATSGIGYLAMNAREFLRNDILVVTLFVYGALGFLSDALVRLLERSALTWRPSFIAA